MTTPYRIISNVDKDAVRRKLDFLDDDLLELSESHQMNVINLYRRLFRGSLVPLCELQKLTRVDLFEVDWKGEEIWNVRRMDFSNVRDVLHFGNNIFHVYFEDGSYIILSQEVCELFPPPNVEDIENPDFNVQDHVKMYRLKKPVVYHFLIKYFQQMNLVKEIL